MGTLRCVQALVKMQAFVRARRARQLHRGGEHEKDNHNSKILVMLLNSNLYNLISKGSLSKSILAFSNLVHNSLMVVCMVANTSVNDGQANKNNSK